jgi:membrane-associated protease RseP (regulator of RpoE activity)
MEPVDGAVAGAKPRRLTPWAWRLIHLGLFLLTLVTTTEVGLLDAQGRHIDTPGFSAATIWLEALSYSLSLMAILLAHELGHYLTARRLGVHASLPFFLPLPFASAFGTLGAFIRMRLDRQVPSHHLLRIAAYGPLAGFVVALPVLIIGLQLSVVAPAPEFSGEGIQLGDSLLMLGLTRLLFGELPMGMDVWLHPMAYAGWAGMFVTAFNMLPVAQLDGGHIAYSLFGERYNKIGLYFFLGLLAMGTFLFTGWLIVAALIFFVIGVDHPPIASDGAVRGRVRWIGIAAFAVFALTFTPVPFVGVAEPLIDSLLDMLP